MLGGAIAPPLAYADEIHYQVEQIEKQFTIQDTYIDETLQQYIDYDEISEYSQYSIEEQREIAAAIQEVDRAFATPRIITEEAINNIVSEHPEYLDELSEERMKEIAYSVLSPYSTRASILDGRGVTLGEFAWAFNIAVSYIISGGISGIGQLVSRRGIAVAKATLSRVATNAAIRIGVYSGLLARLFRWAFNIINIYYNVGYNLAVFIDARDYYPNNGRINAWR